MATKVESKWRRVGLSSQTGTCRIDECEGAYRVTLEEVFEVAPNEYAARERLAAKLDKIARELRA